MKLICIFILSILASNFALAQVNSESIRVRFDKGRLKYLVEGVGIQVYGRPSAYDRIALPKLQKIEISREAIHGKMVWKIVRYLEKRTEISIMTDEVLAIKAIYLKKERLSLPQQIFFWPQSKKLFDVIGILPLEQYLVGVLAGEMPANWPLHTLKAQAIAARSYALSVMQERRNQPFHLENNVLDQVYRSEGEYNPKFIKSVKETENFVLVDKKGRTLKSFFHSDCGGKTASARDVWGQGAATEVVTDSACPSNPKASWVFKISDEDLSKALSPFVGKNGGDFESLQITKMNAEGRAFEFEVKWQNGMKKNILAQDFRQAVGFDKMRSTAFQISRGTKGFIFTGWGYGHGVGLCQWGARGLGLLGKDYIEILKHYYPQASLYLRHVQMPDSKLPELRLGLLKQRQQL